MSRQQAVEEVRPCSSIISNSILKRNVSEKKSPSVTLLLTPRLNWFLDANRRRRTGYRRAPMISAYRRRPQSILIIVSSSSSCRCKCTATRHSPAAGRLNQFHVRTDVGQSGSPGGPRDPFSERINATVGSGRTVRRSCAPVDPCNCPDNPACTAADAAYVELILILISRVNA